MVHWSADDPRVPVLVQNLVAQLEEAATKEWEADPMPASLVALLDGVFLDSVPAAPRILQLMRERGWTGWTEARRIETGR